MLFISARSLGALLSIACPPLTSVATHPARMDGKAKGLVPRDASTLMSGGRNNEWEDHGPNSVPQGAYLTSLPVGTDGDQMAVYWSERSNSPRATQALVTIHGRIRNGNQYWQTLENALANAVRDNYTGASNNSIVVAPQFFSTQFNSIRGSTIAVSRLGPIPMHGKLVRLLRIPVAPTAQPLTYWTRSSWSLAIGPSTPL